MLNSFKWYRKLLGGTWYKVKREYVLNEDLQLRYNYNEHFIITFWTRKPQCDTITDIEKYD